MLADLGNPFEFDLTLTDKRRLVQVLVEIYQLKGTALGVQNVVRFFLGLEVTILPWTGTTMMLGESYLGVDWELGPSGTWALYAFDVQVDELLTDTQRTQLRTLVEYMRCAREHFVNLLEPTTPTVIDHLELGLSSLGEEWILH